MKGGCWKVYLALFLLIVLVAVFPYKEGFSNWLDFSSWFTSDTTDTSDTSDTTDKIDTTDKSETTDKNKTKKYDDYYGTGLDGRSYTTTKTTNESSNDIDTDEHKWLDTSNWGTYKSK